jgi:hypothetical protein
MKKQTNRKWLMAITLIFFVITAFAGIEKEIPLNEVPDVVLKAAQKASILGLRRSIGCT